jgi:hypothetical protein
MTTISAFLLALVGPLALRVMAGLGFSVVSFAAVSEAFGSLVNIAQANWSAMPAGVLQLASLSGIPELMGMIASAYVWRMLFWVATQGTRFVLK